MSAISGFLFKYLNQPVMPVFTVFVLQQYLFFPVQVLRFAFGWQR